MADEMETTTNPTSINELELKMMLTGRVSRIDLYGAFVDIGVGIDGLVHISKIKKGSINRVEEALTVGDEVTVYIDRLDVASNRISLTMIKPLDVTWNEVQVGKVFSGKITRLEPYGAFIDIGAERPGLAHISEMGDQFIRHPNELYAVGDHVDVKVINFDKKKRRIDFSLVVDSQQESAEEEANIEEESLTAMELAMRKAFDETDNDAFELRKRTSRRGSRKNRKYQDDILSRTLRNRNS
ncbi:MAG: 30S ribosomal protein S1 [Anaerolineales bacterium]|nr:30S ribosomal protein S1 [Anaerolineales bacterium]